MSAEAVTVVLHHSQTEGTHKLVLWGIANHHSDAGAWPSIATLAKYARVSERRVQQIIRDLQKMEEILIVEQGGLGQHQYKTNRYYIMLECPEDCDGSLNHRTGVKSSAGRGEIQSPSGVKPVSPEPNKEPNKNLYAHDDDALFTEFWSCYPRKLDKAKAFRAFRSALKRATFEDILAGVIAYRNDPKRNPDFTKYPASWLNADSWENASAQADTPHLERRDKEKEKSDAFLKEQEALRQQAVPPPPSLRKKLGL
jgi:hypothetical protein